VAARAGSRRRRQPGKFYQDLTRGLVEALQVYLDNGVPRVPPAAEDVWDTSHEMEIGRTGYGYGYVRFSWADFAAFCGGPLPPWKRQALRQMETVWLNHKNATPKSEPDKSKPKIGRAFSESLFDAWFGK
jgi:hypothetical protein